MLSITFNQWFAEYLQQDQLQVERLLKDETAIQFLIVWSILESRCFDGYTKVNNLSGFARVVTENNAFQNDDFLEFGRYFHSRYQSKKRYNNLIYKNKNNSIEFNGIISTQFDILSDYQLIFMLLFVVYRFRNNIFHGNKGVESWLKYKEQIDFCRRIMQSIISLIIGTDKNEKNAK